jgi:hypothetical protein
LISVEEIKETVQLHNGNSTLVMGSRQNYLANEEALRETKRDNFALVSKPGIAIDAHLISANPGSSDLRVTGRSGA